MYVDPDGRLFQFAGFLPFFGGGAAATTTTTSAGALGFWGTGAVLGGGALVATIPGSSPVNNDYPGLEVPGDLLPPENGELSCELRVTPLLL